MAAPFRIIVVGGGLAGMAAAVALESAGAEVTLLESRRSLGGRAGSFEDPRTGETLDNCQHVLLGCCTNLMDFYRRVGAADRIRFERTIRFITPDGRRHGLTAIPGLPAPFHLGPAMASFGVLTRAERFAVARAMAAILRLSPADFDRLADVPFGQWLDDHRQPGGAVRKLYDPIVVSGLNEETRRSSAAYAIKIFRDALLIHSAGYVMGFPDCSLSVLYEHLPVKDVRLGARVAGLTFSGSKVTGVTLQDGQALGADVVVLGTNHHSLNKLVPEDLSRTDSRFASLDKLESVPILGAHLWFDRPVLSTPHAALVEGPLQWLFRKDPEGRAVHGVISAARAWASVPKDECLRQFERQVRSVLPDARDAKLDRGVVIVEKRATFSPTPGVDRHRPSQAPPAGGIENLYLAGDYTKTGWPATMEGAVRSGYLAAESVCRATLGEATTGSFLVDDLRQEWPARLARFPHQ